MVHVPLLRRGAPYTSLDVAYAPHHATGEPFAEVSQANVGLIRRDLLAQQAMRASLMRHSTAELVDLTRQAADIFLNGTLPIGSDSQMPDDYVRQLSATTGMPFVMVRRNMQRVANVMQNVGPILKGLTRGLDPAVLDQGFGDVNGQAVSFFPRAQSLGIARGLDHDGQDGGPSFGRGKLAVLEVPLRPRDAEAVGRGPDDARHLDGDLAPADLREGVTGAGVVVQCGRTAIRGPLIGAKPVLADNDRVGRDRADLLDESAEMESNLRIGRAIVGIGGRDGLRLTEIVHLHDPRHHGPACGLPDQCRGKSG